MPTSSSPPQVDAQTHKRNAETALASDAPALEANADQRTHSHAPPSELEAPKQRKKKQRKEIKFSHRNRAKQDTETPHAGSYATRSMRTLFNVELPELSPASAATSSAADTTADTTAADTAAAAADTVTAVHDESTKLNTDAPDDAHDNGSNKKAKKRAAFFMGYLGTNYTGFQMNEDQRTLQAEFELALFRSHLISEQNFGYPNKYGWSTSGRTDKGVHACAQVCSAKIELAPDQTVEQVRDTLNQHLPADLRVLDVVKVTRTFCAKTQRDRVRYQYMIPSFVLMDPAKLASIFTTAGCTAQGRSPSNPLTADEVALIQSHVKDYRATLEQREQLKKALQVFEGTHSFHNYAKGVGAKEARAQRYIESFQVEDPVVFENGMEWIPTQVLGQSFLLNQIRKMVCMAMDVARGVAPLETVEKGLSKDNDIRVNLAPAQGLYMEMAYYGGYNRRKQKNPELKDLDWTDEKSAVYQRWKEFRNGTLMKHVGEEEEREGNFVKYAFVQDFISKPRRMYQLEDES